MAEMMSSYLPLGIPASTKLPSAFVTVPLELPLRNTLTPTRGLPVAESLTDPVMILFCAWAKKQEVVNRAINRDEILFMEYREINLSHENKTKMLARAYSSPKSPLFNNCR